MIEGLSTWIPLLFILIFFYTLIMFHLANGIQYGLTLGILIWSIFHSVLAYSGFYLVTDSYIPRFGLILIPVLLFLILGLMPKKRKWMVRERDLRFSTLLHTVRFPMEIILYYLYLHATIPELMTFEGMNFDILVGITAPIVAVLWWKGKISDHLLLYWNIIGLGFIIWIYILGIFSSELPFQLFAFEQPNRAVSYFPFVLLPASIVPMVIYSHIIDIIKLSKNHSLG